MKKNTITILIVIATVILAGVAVFTAIRLWQAQTTAPTVPGAQTANCGSSCSSDANCLGGTICDPQYKTCRNPECVANIGACDPTGCTAVITTCGGVGCNIGQSLCSQGVCDSSTNQAGVCDCSISPSPSPSATAQISACQLTVVFAAASPSPSPSPSPAISPSPSPSVSPSPVPQLPEAGISLPTILGGAAGVLLLVGALLLAL